MLYALTIMVCVIFLFVAIASVIFQTVIFAKRRISKILKEKDD